MIGFSLCKNDRDDIYGILRNIQLAKIFFASWNIRIYIPKNLLVQGHRFVRNNWLTKMKSLGAEIHFVDLKDVKVPPHLISSLLLDDSNISHFIIREPRDRLEECDFIHYNNFMLTNKTLYIRKSSTDFDSQSFILRNWGGRRKNLLTYLGGIAMKVFFEVHKTMYFFYGH